MKYILLFLLIIIFTYALIRILIGRFSPFGKFREIIGLGEYDNEFNDLMNLELIDAFNLYKSSCIKKANNFDVLLCAHLNDKKFNGKKELLAKSLIAPTTLNDLINKISIPNRKITIYKIALTLQLTPTETYELLKSRGYSVSYNSLKELCYTFFIEDDYGRKNYDLETLHWLLSYNGY